MIFVVLSNCLAYQQQKECTEFAASFSVNVPEDIWRQWLVQMNCVVNQEREKKNVRLALGSNILQDWLLQVNLPFTTRNLISVPTIELKTGFTSIQLPKNN